MLISNILKILLIIALTSCSKNIEKESIINEKNLELQVYEAYTLGLESLEKGDALYAAKKFNEAEVLFPQSVWAPKAALMAAYSYYSQDYLKDAIAETERFFKVYPKNENLDYAYYLTAVSYYELIVDEKKDLQSIINSKKYFKLIINNYPNTEYAVDSKFKLDLIDDILASKEMYLARYYLKKKKWIPAINRFRTVVDDYDTTIYIEEALYRLVETYYLLGLTNEAEKYAKLLGYNYQSSKWYENSYKIFNKSYQNQQNINKINNKKQSRILKKIKSLLD